MSSPYKFTLSIDRIQVEFRTSRTTQAWRLCEGLGASFVVGLTESGAELTEGTANTPCDRFKATIQDPSNFRVLQSRLDDVGGQDGRVVLLEVALDVCIPGASKEDLAMVVADCYRRATVVPAGHWHLYKRAKSGSRRVGESDVIDKRTLVRLLADGHQLADVYQRDQPAVRHHLYVKTWNAGGQLPPREWKARHEVTLQGVGLRSGELADLDIKALAEHFRYRRLVNDLNRYVRSAVEWSGKQYGRKGSYGRHHRSRVGVYSGDPTAFRRFTEADASMNEAVRVGLRKLERQWRSAVVHRPVAVVDQDFRTTEAAPDTESQATKSSATPMSAGLSLFSTSGSVEGASNNLEI